ncbi:UDP-N-acetylglucosamine 2-epimerase [Candidatus Bipolaricaulota bacterium]|nr:UDP-N-acetylglucosamine 2-epimerase [Candidatus Bipolaricaulota bacterium]
MDYIAWGWEGEKSGVQQEAFFFRVPCLNLREEREWMETVKGEQSTLVSVIPGA